MLPLPFALSSSKGKRTQHDRWWTGERPRHKFTQLLHVLGLLFISFLSFPATAEGSHFFSLNTGDLKAELADARSDGKRALLLFFEQEGCPGCRHMKENVFARKEVETYYRQNFVSLALDIHGSVPLRDFAGRELTEKDYARGLKIRATPTFVFFDPAGAEIVRIVGPLETPQEFLLLGRFVTSGAYKTRSFAQYKLEKPIQKGS